MYALGHQGEHERPAPLVHCVQVPNRRVLFFSAVIYLGTGISGWSIFLSSNQTAWLKCFAIFKRHKLLQVAPALLCNISKSIPKAKFMIEEASAWASSDRGS